MVLSKDARAPGLTRAELQALADLLSLVDDEYEIALKQATDDDEIARCKKVLRQARRLQKLVDQLHRALVEGKTTKASKASPAQNRFTFSRDELEELHALLTALDDDEDSLIEGQPPDVARSIRATQRRTTKMLKRLDQALRGRALLKMKPHAIPLTVSLRDTQGLTRAELDRQDVVDHAIYKLINELRPDAVSELPWCIGCIARVRDALTQGYCEHVDGFNPDDVWYPTVKEA